MMDLLVNSLCDVVFLCDEMEPNWLGLVSLGIGVVISAYLILDHVAKYISGKR